MDDRCPCCTGRLDARTCAFCEWVVPPAEPPAVCPAHAGQQVHSEILGFKGRQPPMYRVRFEGPAAPAEKLSADGARWEPTDKTRRDLAFGIPLERVEDGLAATLGLPPL